MEDSEDRIVPVCPSVSPGYVRLVDMSGGYV